MIFLFTKKINERIKVIFLILILLFIFIVVRVLYIQLIEYDKLTNLANDLWSRNLPLKADRGLILDRNGVVLADNITTTSDKRIFDNEIVVNTMSETDKSATFRIKIPYRNFLPCANVQSFINLKQLEVSMKLLDASDFFKKMFKADGATAVDSFNAVRTFEPPATDCK